MMGEEGDKSMLALLGGKGANLAEMIKLGFPVPPVFTITTKTCNEYLDQIEALPKTLTKEQKHEAIEKLPLPQGLMGEVKTAMNKLEAKTGNKFGDTTNPLLVSVRSGAAISMPGMMETVLNVGLNDQTVQAIAKKSNNERFAFDSYRRLIQMFGGVVLEIDKDKFEKKLDAAKKELQANKDKYPDLKNVEVIEDKHLRVDQLKKLVSEFKQVIKDEGKEFPQEPMKQLEEATKAVFKSWNGDNAITYRNKEGIPNDLGTAVNVQAMVFGNMGEKSASGVLFSRDSNTGEARLDGDYLINAQGEDVVAGIRLTSPFAQLAKDMPEVYNQLRATADKLEKHYKIPQDMEFTIEEGKLYMLQTRTAKLSAKAHARATVELVSEGLNTKKEALLQADPKKLGQLLLPQFDLGAVKEAKKAGDMIGKGLGASPGAASGIVVFDKDTAVALAEQGKKVILAREETVTDDVKGMFASQGILTAKGGNTSHASVVCKGAGIPCVVGCKGIHIDVENKELSYVNKAGETIVVKEGQPISLDGATGEVFIGEIKSIRPKELDANLKTLIDWANEVKTMKVETNADTPVDVRKAKEHTAQGIGLCRTEHMFLEPERLAMMREMILAGDDKAARQAALDKAMPLIKADYKDLMKVMDGEAVTVRYLDPPLHEFLPAKDDLIREVTELKTKLDILGKLNPADTKTLEEKEALLTKVESLSEINPMLGNRGCRLGLQYPEINAMQTRAIIEAACELKKEGFNPKPQIMIPLVTMVSELKESKSQVDEVAKEVMKEQGVDVNYKFGTMIETPRAALIAGQLAPMCDFFSFGTNDLTQTVFGLSRDDADGIVTNYIQNGLMKDDPCAVLDQEGVGKMVADAIKAGKAANPNLECAICGEHGGEAKSVRFLNTIGMDTVSCSPYRVPEAIISAAQAALGKK
ncbi:MAG: pyruvate, phosphate dikinase [Vampirovibrionia bacterium]